MGVVNSGIPFICYAYAVMSITTGLSSILNSTTPLFGALLVGHHLLRLEYPLLAAIFKRCTHHDHRCREPTGGEFGAGFARHLVLA